MKAFFVCVILFFMTTPTILRNSAAKIATTLCSTYVQWSAGTILYFTRAVFPLHICQNHADISSLINEALLCVYIYKVPVKSCTKTDLQTHLTRSIPVQQNWCSKLWTVSYFTVFPWYFWCIYVSQDCIQSKWRKWVKTFLMSPN